MIDTHQALAALREANPVVDERALSGAAAWSMSDLLLEVTRRTEMQTQELTAVEPNRSIRPPKRSKGPLIALATAAAVLAVGLAFAVVSLGGDTAEPEPATTAAPTTTVAPVINVEDGAAALIGRTWTVVDGRSFSRPTRIEFANDGSYQVFDAGRLVDSGVTTTNADVITFESAPTDEVTWVQNDVFLRVTDSCEGVVGQYQVVLATPSRVALQVISDGCPPRVGVANGLQLEPAQP